jgi:hypothetical protein
MNTSSNPSNAPALARRATANVEQSYTRPADTTTYAAGDVVANSTSAAVVLGFANVARGAGLGGTIQSARIIFSTAPATKLDSELWLFDTSPTMQNDNAAFAPSIGNLGALIGVIALPAANFKAGSGNGVIDVQNLALSFQCSSASTSLFGVLVARNAYVPASAEVLKVRLTIAQD